MQIQSVSPGLILAFTALHAKKQGDRDEVDLKEMFFNLSLELGGDGETINKKDLDDYIKMVDSGKKSMSKSRLSALKMIQQQWDNISTDKDKEFITASDMKDYFFLLVMATTDTFEVPESSEDAKSILEAMLQENENSDENTKLADLLKKMLSGTTDENDDANANLIDALTNMIALQSANSSVETEA